jgi:ubiquinone/menaquinone biosynthesis C-methylase UbiE
MGKRTFSGVNYDAIVHLYDAQPYRAKAVDLELIKFMERCVSDKPLLILDIACGMGSQLVANRSIVPDARMVGLDRSFGMLQQALLKASDITWDGLSLCIRWFN